MLQWSVVGGRERRMSEAMKVVTEQGVSLRMKVNLGSIVAAFFLPCHCLEIW